MFKSGAYIFETDYPGDVSGLEEFLSSGAFQAKDVEGVMITHEGDLWANAYTALEVATVLARHLNEARDDVMARIPIQSMAGASGFMPPNTAVFTRSESDVETVGGDGGPEKRFSVAGSCTRRLEPTEIGTAEYVLEVARTVRKLMERAEMEGPEDVHLVFVKTPWPNPERYMRNNPGRKLLTDDWWRAGAYGRGGGALGVALALGEISEDELTVERIEALDPTLFSSVAQCSSTEDRDRAAVILFGNSAESTSDLVISHGTLKDGLDTDGVKTVLRNLGFQFSCCPTAEDHARIRYAWLKPNTAETSELRGYRHTLTSHPQLGPFWWSVEKGPIHGMAAPILGTMLMEVATGAEHQGPDGHPLLAVLAEVDSAQSASDSAGHE